MSASRSKDRSLVLRCSRSEDETATFTRIHAVNTKSIETEQKITSYMHDPFMFRIRGAERERARNRFLFSDGIRDSKREPKRNRYTDTLHNITAHYVSWSIACAHFCLFASSLLCCFFPAPSSSSARFLFFQFDLLLLSVRRLSANICALSLVLCLLSLSPDLHSVCSFLF